MWVRVDPQALQETGEIHAVGEPVLADASITKCDRNGFEITYLAYLFDVFDQLGGQKYKVFKYIVEHKSTDNTLIITNRELAEKCGVSTQTVYECIKLLKEKGLIAKPTHDHIIRFTPPLVIDRDQMMEAIGIIKDTFAQF